MDIYIITFDVYWWPHCIELSLCGYTPYVWDILRIVIIQRNIHSGQIYGEVSQIILAEVMAWPFQEVKNTCCLSTKVTDKAAWLLPRLYICNAPSAAPNPSRAWCRPKCGRGLGRTWLHQVRQGLSHLYLREVSLAYTRPFLENKLMYQYIYICIYLYIYMIYIRIYVYTYVI